MDLEEIGLMVLQTWEMVRNSTPWEQLSNFISGQYHGYTSQICFDRLNFKRIFFVENYTS